MRIPSSTRQNSLDSSALKWVRSFPLKRGSSFGSSAVSVGVKTQAEARSREQRIRERSFIRIFCRFSSERGKRNSCSEMNNRRLQASDHGEHLLQTSGGFLCSKTREFATN